MKILFCINGLDAGGKERRLIELMKGLKLISDIEFELVVMNKDIHYKEVFDLGIKIHYFIRKTKKDLSVFNTLYNYCKKKRPDIIHCWDSMTAVYCTPACKLLHIWFVNSMVVDVPAKKNILNKNWLRARLTFPFSNLIVGNSLAGLKAYKAPKSKSVCIYNGFNFDRAKNITAQNILKNKFNILSPYVVLMVGALDKRKDYNSFIEAARVICKNRNDVEFIIVGDGPDLSIISNKIERFPGSKIKLLGRQSDVESIISFSDICVLSTNSKIHGEGISNSILEYMALGKPVVATSGGGTNEIVEDQKTGFLVSPLDPLKLAEKIEILLDDSELRKRMGSAGRERIQNYFSIDEMVNKYISVYRNLKLKSVSTDMRNVTL